VVLPNRHWISDFYRGVKSLGGRSFCTIAPTDFHVETELLSTDQQVLRAIRSALGVDHTTFRLMLNGILSRALRCDVRSRENTVRFTSTGGRGGKRTMEHVSPESSADPGTQGGEYPPPAAWPGNSEHHTRAVPAAGT
jgi:hypothetical protein